MKIYLDDERTPPEGWTLLKTAEEVIALLKETKVTELSLDHDLGQKLDGNDVLLFLENELKHTGNLSLLPERIYLHTANPVGRKEMEMSLASIQKIVQELLYED